MTEEYEWNGLRVRRSTDSPSGWETDSKLGDGRLPLIGNWGTPIAAELDSRLEAGTLKLYPLPPEPEKRVELNGHGWVRDSEGWWRPEDGWNVDSGFRHALDRIWEFEQELDATVPPPAEPDESPRTVTLHTGEKLTLGEEDAWWVYAWHTACAKDDDRTTIGTAVRTLDLLQNGPRPGLGEEE